MLSLLYKIGLPILAIGIIIGIIHHYDTLSSKLQQANQTISIQKGQLNDYQAQTLAYTKSIEQLKTSLQEQKVNDTNAMDLLNRKLHSSKYSPTLSKKTTTTLDTYAKALATANTRLIAYAQVITPYAWSCYHLVTNWQNYWSSSE